MSYSESVSKLRKVNSSLLFIWLLQYVLTLCYKAGSYISDACTAQYVPAEVCLISQLEKQMMLLDRMELVENFFYLFNWYETCLLCDSAEYINIS